MLSCGFPLAGLHGDIWLPALCCGLRSRVGRVARGQAGLSQNSSSLCQGWGLVSSSSMEADAKAEATVTCEGSLGRGRISPCCLSQGSQYLAAHQICMDQSWAGPGQDQALPPSHRAKQSQSCLGLSILRHTSSGAGGARGAGQPYPCAVPALPAVPSSHDGPGLHCGQGR